MYNVKNVVILTVFGILSPFAHAEVKYNAYAVTIPPQNPQPLKNTQPPQNAPTIILSDSMIDFMKDPTKPVEIKIIDRQSGAIMKPIVRALDVQIIAYKPTGGSFVVINGKRFMEGDVFDNTTIQRIEKNRVILSNPERKPLVLEYATLSIKKSGGSKP